MSGGGRTQVTERTHTIIDILVAIAILVGAAAITSAPSRPRPPGTDPPAVGTR